MKEVVKIYDYYIFDCDGVIWNDHHTFDHAKHAIRYLRESRKELIFLSNVNRSPRSELHKKLNKEIGIDIDIKNCYTASYLTAHFIKNNFPYVKKVYLVGRKGLQDELEEAGFEVHGGPMDDNKIITVRDVEGMSFNEELQAVVCGSDDYISFYKIAYASNIIERTKLFFGTNFDNAARVGDNIIPAAYTYISALEAATDRKAVIITKPSPYSIDMIMKEHKIDYNLKNKILMVGDSLRTDIKFANNSKVNSCLVFTGLTLKQEYENLKDEDKKMLPSPNYLIDCLKL
jgi:4-nitrophenyl phosphatase